MEKCRMQQKTEYEEFHKRLAPFPTSFRLVGRDELGDTTLRSIRNHLEAALKAKYRTNMETAQSLNLLSFVLFTLKDKRAALDRVNEALDLDGQNNNIVSLANKASILWSMQGPLLRREADKQITTLESLMKAEDFDYLIVRAKAELAASYMRFGHRFNKNAVDAFNEVISEGREPEVWNWKLARAVAYRHTLDLQHAPHACGEEENKHIKVLQMFQEIADKSNCPPLKANALAEMALVLWSTWDVKTGQALCKVVEAGPMKICKDALKCDENEPSVLRKVGKIFRYYKDVHNSLKYLKKAVKLQPSSAAYHHLGLTYKAFATEHKHGTLRKRRGRRSGGRRRGRQQGQPSREQDEADINQDDRNVQARGKKEVKDTVRPQATFQNERGGRPGRGQRQREPGVARGGSGAGHWRGRGRGRANTHTTEQNSPSELKQSLHASYSTENDASEGISMETDDTHLAVGGVVYPQTTQNESSLGSRILHGHTRAHFTEPRNECPQQERRRHRQHDGETDSQFLCPESCSPLSRPEGEIRNSSDSETELKKIVHESGYGDTESDEDAEQDGVNGSKVERLQKTIKSPPNRGITKFFWDDRYVEDAVDSLKEAVAFSAEENTRALYDLALMYKALEEYDKALECLEKIYGDCDNGLLSSAGPLDEITAYEQAGLIKQEMADGVQDDRKKERLKEDADLLLNAALDKAFEYYSESAELRRRFADVFQSPRTLLRAVKMSDKCRQDKRKIRAKILRLIHEHPKSLAILEKMAAADPQSTDDAECQGILIKNHCDMGKFDEAVRTFQIAKATQLVDEVLQWLGPEYVQKMYLEAGRRALQRPSFNAGMYFRSAFTDTFNKLTALRPTSRRSLRDNATADASIGEEQASDNNWDIVMLHETVEEEGEEIEEKAEAVTFILRRCCGLRVTRMDEDVPFGSQSDFEIIKTAEKSHLLVVLVGKDTLSKILQHQVQMTMFHNVRTAVLLVNGAHLPESMQTYQSQTMDFPLTLMNVTAEHATNVGEIEAAAIVDLFSFLLSCGKTAGL